ncbi:hypothetical protein DICVIV_09574, partial [Dictyocaulus viviparus]
MLLDKCQTEKTIDSYGGINWREATANSTVQVPCEVFRIYDRRPYNSESDKQKVQRVCEWNRRFGRATWGRQKEMEKCKSQSSILTHLGMLGTFAFNANGVSTIHTVARFIKDLLQVPAFSTDPSSTAHFDQKIAEQAALVIDSILRIDFDSLQGNTSLAKYEIWSVLLEFTDRLPSPFTLVSPDFGLHLKAMQWVSDSDNFDTVLGTKCRVKLPTASADHVVRSICMANASLFDIVNSHNPVLSLKLDSSDSAYFTKMMVMLKPKDFVQNYTCVYFDTKRQFKFKEAGQRMGFVALTKTITDSFSDYVYLAVLVTHRLYMSFQENYFLSDDDPMKDVRVLLPTVTTNETLDFALLVHLFFVFMIHVAHLVMLIAPQVGEPFSLLPALNLILQFAIISVTATLYLVLTSIRAILMAHNRMKDVDEKFCTRPCSVVVLGICEFLLPYHSAKFLASNPCRYSAQISDENRNVIQHLTISKSTELFQYFGVNSSKRDTDVPVTKWKIRRPLVGVPNILAKRYFNKNEEVYECESPKQSFERIDWLLLANYLTPT